MNYLKLSPFWKTPNFSEGERIVVRNLGDFYKDMEFRGVVRGVYACDVDGNPDCYIIELIDKIPHNPEWGYNAKDEYVRSFSCHMFPRGCVFSPNDVLLKDEGYLPTNL